MWLGVIPAIVFVLQTTYVCYNKRLIIEILYLQLLYLFGFPLPSLI